MYPIRRAKAQNELRLARKRKCGCMIMFGTLSALKLPCHRCCCLYTWKAYIPVAHWLPFCICFTPVSSARYHPSRHHAGPVDGQCSNFCHPHELALCDTCWGNIQLVEQRTLSGARAVVAGQFGALLMGLFGCTHRRPHGGKVLVRLVMGFGVKRWFLWLSDAYSILLKTKQKC